ncbi:MAG: hypothetical protein NTX71_02760 [Candidatus Aureabacteria bacterium]|nr:hypothetical protein [Candidatus Auribacterota bacterium]
MIVSGTTLPFLNLPLRAKIAFEKGEAEEGIDAAQNYNKRFASASRGRIPPKWRIARECNWIDVTHRVNAIALKIQTSNFNI